VASFALQKKRYLHPHNSNQGAAADNRRDSALAIQEALCEPPLPRGERHGRAECGERKRS